MSRIRISASRAPRFFSSMTLGSTQVHSSTKRPMTMPPTRAPKGLPSPPSVMAANISSRRLKPMSQRTCCSRPSRIPPSPARPAPTTHTMRMIRSVLMPVVDARSGLSETARMALPVLVRSSQQRHAERGEHADRHRDHRAGGQVDRPDLRRRLHGVLAVGAGATAERELEDVARGDADADRDDHHRRQADAATPQRFEDQALRRNHRRPWPRGCRGRPRAGCGSAVRTG